MRNCILLAVVVCLPLSAAASSVIDINWGFGGFGVMDFYPVDDAGNAPDPRDLDGNGSNALQPHGSVNYRFIISATEVPRQFIEQINLSSGLEITLDPLYDVGYPAHGKMPATGISWNEAARVVNWMNTSKRYPPAYKFDKQPGEVGYDPNANAELWQPGDLGYNPLTPVRNNAAHFFLPTADEWYKAAAYDPHKDRLGNPGYWDFAVKRDLPWTPLPAPNGVQPGTVVFDQPLWQGPALVGEEGDFSAHQTVGQSGNAAEWDESAADLVSHDPAGLHGVNGGDWSSPNKLLVMTHSRYGAAASFESEMIGFRVAGLAGPDFNSDGSIDAGDAGIMFSTWGDRGIGDWNADGITDASDAASLFAAWTGDLAPRSIPEPSSGVLAALSTLGLLLRRRGANQFPK